jgi:[protein-PII] uridylyltransferase
MIASPTLSGGVKASPLEPLRADPLPGLAAFRGALDDAQKALVDRFVSGEPAHLLVLERASIIDEVLIAAWRRESLDRASGVALVAVGGYGRGELHPASDVDILVLQDEARDDVRVSGIQAFVAFLWDLGIEVGHSVRTVEESVAAARADITVATSLMESRLLAGCRDLFVQMKRRTGADAVWQSRAFFEAKWQEQQERHHKFHDTAYNLEPNVKEGPGGLRDIQMVGWVVKRHFDAGSLHELVDHAFLTESEYRALIGGQNFLWQVRFALHVLTGRREDRLLFDYQVTLAEQFGFEGDSANLAVEQFMKSYYRTIMELSRLNEMLLELFQEAILLEGEDETPIAVNRRFQVVNGFLEVTGEHVFRRYPFALLELFLILLEILKQPRGLTHELHRMHRYGVLGAYLPEFEAVVGRMQYDLFHAYTVDEHSLKVVGNLRAYAVEKHRAALPMCAEIFDRLPKPELLYIAGLFHDLAKGREEDHSELGAEFALEFCRVHALSEYDSRLVSWLVRNHLLMSVTAQRKDITDPDIVNEFAGIVGDRVHLDYLYLLTIGDIRGTNPSLWNDWKATLLRDLYMATARALWRGLENPVDRQELIAETQTEARGLLGAAGPGAGRIWANFGEDYFLRHTADEIAWHTQAIVNSEPHALPLVLVRNGRGGTEIFVYARDQEFLFAATTSVLGRLGLNIMDSRIITADNAMTLDSYVVHDMHGSGPCEAERLPEIAHRLHDALKSPGSARQVDSRIPRRQLKHFSIRSDVSFADDRQNRRTVMEVVARDRPGLLARVGWALADCKVRLQNAKIITIGERAEDVFFITDAHNRPLDPARFDEIRQAVVAAVNEGV